VGDGTQKNGSAPSTSHSYLQVLILEQLVRLVVDRLLLATAKIQECGEANGENGELYKGLSVVSESFVRLTSKAIPFLTQQHTYLVSQHAKHNETCKEELQMRTSILMLVLTP